jgi:hypothetical protein
MFERNKKQGDTKAKRVSPDKRAEILQATFKHYYEMAMDHHTKAATTSNILLIIVGGIIGLIGVDNNLGGIVDLVGGFGVFVIGIFGRVWALKQHERYHFWEHIAYEYQKELAKIVPMKRGEEYYAGAEDASVKEFGSFIAKTVEDRKLWSFLHSVVAFVGVLLMAFSLYSYLTFGCP